MKTSNFNKEITAEFLNENMFKQFGTRIDLSKYDREQLENYRNLLRTKISQSESAAGFNDLLANEDYQKDKHMLNLLNTRIKEMLGEAKKMKQAVDAFKAKQKKDDAKQGKTEKKLPPFMKKKKDDADDAEVDSKPSKKPEKKKEQKLKENVSRILGSIRTYIAEDEEGKAKDITAGTDMVNDFTSWMQRVGQYQTKSMIELSDSIRANFGYEDAETFKRAVMPALQATLDTLAQSREEISQAVAILAGEENVVPMGQGQGQGPEAGAPVPGQEALPGGENDEFAASDAAAGGPEITGRLKRESKEFIKSMRLAEEHSIISKLAK